MEFVFSWLPTLTLVAMMLALGMELRPADFFRLAKQPRPLCLGLLGQWLLLPGVALALITLLPLPATVAVGLIIVAACPGGAVSNMFSRYGGGDVALSISLTAIASVVAPLSVPLILTFAMQVVLGEAATIILSFAEMVLTLLTTTALPVAIGMVILHFRQSLAARLRGPLLAVSTTILLLLIIALGVGTAVTQEDGMAIFGRSLVPAFLLLAVTSALMVAFSRLLGLGYQQTRTVVLEAGIQNINLALVIALNFLSDSRFLGPSLTYLPLMLIFGLIVVLLGHQIGTTSKLKSGVE